MNTLTKTHVETLIKTWMICEATIHLQECLRSEKKEIFHRFKACASSCFNIARELMAAEGFVVEEEIIACMMECRSCRIICDQFPDIHEIAYCGTLCELCYRDLNKIYHNRFQLN